MALVGGGKGAPGTGGIGMPGAGGIGMPGAGGIGIGGRPGGGGKLLPSFFFLPSPMRAPQFRWEVICP